MKNQVATTILNQLGGNKFLAMTGSYNLVAGEKMLAMKLRRNQSKSNYLRITLTSMDDYLMEFISTRGASVKVKNSFEGVYFDQLQSIFTDITGMYTKLF
jgi:hypothetical protein